MIQSILSTCIGSTEAARRAGSRQASISGSGRRLKVELIVVVNLIRDPGQRLIALPPSKHIGKLSPPQVGTRSVGFRLNPALAPDCDAHYLRFFHFPAEGLAPRAPVELFPAADGAS